MQHLDFLDDHEKAVFKTAFELDQRWLIEHAADRTPFICQSQSLNIFLPADVHKRDLHQIHMMAWKRGVKIALLLPLALHPARRASVSSDAPRLAVGDQALCQRQGSTAPAPAGSPCRHAGACAEASSADYEECLSCQ